MRGRYLLKGAEGASLGKTQYLHGYWPMDEGLAVHTGSFLEGSTPEPCLFPDKCSFNVTPDSSVSDEVIDSSDSPLKAKFFLS